MKPFRRCAAHHKLPSISAPERRRGRGGLLHRLRIQKRLTHAIVAAAFSRRYCPAEARRPPNAQTSVFTTFRTVEHSGLGQTNYKPPNCLGTCAAMPAAAPTVSTQFSPSQHGLRGSHATTHFHMPGARLSPPVSAIRIAPISPPFLSPNPYPFPEPNFPLS